MVSLEEILPGLVVGGAVALGAAVLTGQASRGDVKENARQLVLELNQQIPQPDQGGGDQRPHQPPTKNGNGGSSPRRRRGPGGRATTERAASAQIAQEVPAAAAQLDPGPIEEVTSASDTVFRSDRGGSLTEAEARVVSPVSDININPF